MGDLSVLGFEEPPDITNDEQPTKVHKEANLSIEKADVINSLDEFGYGTGFHNPFADEENKALEKKLENLQLANLNRYRDSQFVGKYVEVLSDQNNNIINNIQLTRIIREAKERQLEREMTIFRQTQRDFKFLKNGNNRMTGELEGLQKRNRRQMKWIEKRKKLTDEAMGNIEEDTKWMKKYVELANKSEHTNGIVDKMETYDSSEIEKYQRQLSKLAVALNSASSQLKSQTTLTKEATDTYYRTCAEFRIHHRKRKEIIAMWNATLRAIRARDVEIQKMAIEFYDAREKLLKVASTHECLTNFLRNKVDEKDDTIYRTKYYEKQIQKLHELYEKFKKEITGYEMDESYMNGVLQNLTRQSQELKTRLKLIREEMESIIEKEEKIIQVVKGLKDRKYEVLNAINEKGNLVQKLENMIEKEEQFSLHIERRGEVFNKCLFERNQEKVKLNEDVANARTKIRLVHRFFNMLNSKEYENVSEMSKSHTRIYRIDLEISTLEVKISRVMNTTVEPKYFHLQEKVETLRSRVRYIISSNNHITREVDYLKTALAMAFTDLEYQKDTKRALDSSIRNLNFEINEMNYRNDGFREDVTQSTVDLTLMNLRATRMKKTLECYGGNITSLLQMQNIIKTAASERRMEINVRTDIMKKQKSLLNREIQFVQKMNFRANAVIQAFRLKFETLLGVKSLEAAQKMQGEQKKGLAKTMEKLIQQRTNLKKQLFMWKLQVEKDQKEFEALVNVHRVMQLSNCFYDKHLHTENWESKPC